MKKLTGYRETVGTGKRIYDEDVYKLIKKRSRLIDRVNPRKMIFMSELAYAIMDEAMEEPSNPKWKFFGRNAPKD